MSDFLLNPAEWPSNPDDFMDLFQFDTNLLFSDGSSTGSCGPDSMNDITSSLINNLQNGFNYNDLDTPMGGTEQPLSPMSSLGSDQEFHGFPNSCGASLDGSGYDEEFTGSKSPEEVLEPVITTKMELDEAMNEFATFERNVEQQHLLEQQQLQNHQQQLSSNASDSGLSSDNLDFDPQTDYEALSPALSSPGPSISERGGQNSPPRYVKPVSVQPSQIVVKKPPSVAVPSVSSVVSKAGRVYQTVKTVVTGRNDSKTSNAPKVVVEKIQPNIDSNSHNITLNKNHMQTTTLANGKEVKIYRVAPVRNNQQHANVANNANTSKRVTLQLKNGSTSTVATKTGGTVFLNNKNVVLTSSPSTTPSGIRKIIRVQQQQQQNGRSILVPVSIQDLRTIKIVNSPNMKSKSANIKLAAANLLQQSKQGLIQKNVVLTKEQLIVDDSDATQNSDSESFVFEDIMHQSNSVIEQVERRQKQQKLQSLVSDSDAEQDQDDDMDGDDTSSLNKPGSGGYQKLILTAEEKRLLAKEGISLPTSYPLTKHEERELKRIRRKIRNKISAQDSRKRKKEYVDGLEERVKQCTEENQNLLKRIKILQSQNHDLMSQMKKIQSLLTKGTGKTTQPATCLMVLLLSMALVAVPNLKLGGSHHQQNIQDSIEMAELLQDAAAEKTQVETLAQNRRSLLFNTKEQLGDALVDEEMNFDDIALNMNSLIASEHDYSSEEEPKAKKARTSSLVDYDVDDDIWNGSSKMRIKQEAEELFDIQQKSKQFQEAFENRHTGHTSGFNIKTEHSEVIVDSDLLEAMSKKELYHNLNLVNIGELAGKQGSNIELLGAGNLPANSDPENVEEVGRKLNASQQIHQQNSKRKLLL